MAVRQGGNPGTTCSRLRFGKRPPLQTAPRKMQSRNLPTPTSRFRDSDTPAYRSRPSSRGDRLPLFPQLFDWRLYMVLKILAIALCSTAFILFVLATFFPRPSPVPIPAGKHSVVLTMLNLSVMLLGALLLLCLAFGGCTMTPVQKRWTAVGVSVLATGALVAYQNDHGGGPPRDMRKGLQPVTGEVR